MTTTTTGATGTTAGPATGTTAGPATGAATGDATDPMTGTPAGADSATDTPAGADSATGTAAPRLRDGWEPDTPSEDTIVLAGFRAMMARSERWARAAGGRVLRLDANTVFTDSGSECPYLNEAITTEPLSLDLARQVRDFFPPGRPFVVCSPRSGADSRETDAGPGSPRSGADLTAAGLTLVGHPPFMVRPAGPPPAGWLPPGVTIEEVRDQAGLATWADVLAEGFPTRGVTAPTALLGGPHRFWVARADGVPVASSAASVGHGVVDVESIATLPAYRGRGIGAAVTWAATLADPTLPAVLIASDPGRPVYQRMGYLPLLRATMWTP